MDDDFDGSRRASRIVGYLLLGALIAIVATAVILWLTAAMPWILRNAEITF